MFDAPRKGAFERSRSKRFGRLSVSFRKVSFRDRLEMTGAAREDSMRMLFALLVIAYLVGVGVMIAPTIKANWSTVPASQFVESIVAELPRALSWPATAYRGIVENQGDPGKPSAAK
jgi:hypothetical protein